MYIYNKTANVFFKDTNSDTDKLTCSLTQSPTHRLTNSLPHSLSLTSSLIQPLIHAYITRLAPYMYNCMLVRWLYDPCSVKRYLLLNGMATSGMEDMWLLG